MKPASAAQKWKKALIAPSFWSIMVILLALTLLHYFRLSLLPSPINAFLSRHAVDRILFVLPIALATHSFGLSGGLTTLALIVLVMLPRAIWVSAQPVDALVETVAAVVVGGLVTWLIDIQAREKNLRQKAISQLSAINTVTTTVTESLDLEHILHDALDKILQVTDLEVGLIFLRDEQTQELTLAAHRGISEASAAQLERLRPDDSFWGKAFQSGEVTVMEDCASTPAVLQQEQLQTQVLLPVKSKGNIRGLLVVATREHWHILPEEIELITAIGSAMGVAIENAQLHQDVARQLQVQQLLNEVAERIASELELNRVLSKVIQIAEELTGATGGGIALFDKEKDSIHYPHLHNLPQELADVSVPKGQGAAGQVIETGQPVIIDDYQAYPSAIPAFVEARLTSVVTVPIVSGDRVFGALSLVSTEKGKRFTKRDVAILAGIGRQTGIAIENARLYENMRFYARQITRAQEDERKRIARELHDETIQTLILISRRLEGLAMPGEHLSEAAEQRLSSLQELISNALRDIRRFVRDLRPPTLDHLGLVAAVEGLAGDLTEEDIIYTEVKVTGNARRLMPDEELVLFRIAQEALSNVRRHSQASQATVHVEFWPSQVRMMIYDNGRGFDAPDRIDNLVSTGKLGLAGMYERARTLGGMLAVQSKPGEGTTVIVDVPAQPAPADTGDSA